VILVISDTGIGVTPETIGQLLHDIPVPSSVGPHGDKGAGVGLGLGRNWLSGLGVKRDFRSQVNVGANVIMNIPGTGYWVSECVRHLG